MKTLEEAWQWYISAKNQLHLFQRLGQRYWDRLPWAKCLTRDDHFRDLEQAEVVEGTALTLAYLDDLAVVVLFSVFEAIVRHQVADEVEQEERSLQHRTLKWAAQEAKKQIEEGSFFWVLEPYKDRYANLVEEVHQVRRYRNWVAHGKKGKQPDNIGPAAAYRRLGRFLEILDVPGANPPSG
jgi:hypothetical protein